MKKIVALMLVLVLVLGLASTAFAASRIPTVSLTSRYKNKTIDAGDSFKFVFTLNSRDYSKIGSTSRAKFVAYVAEASTGLVIAYKEIAFNGKLNYKLNLSGALTWDMAGKYNVFYATYYQEGGYWYPAYMHYTKLKVVP